MTDLLCGMESAASVVSCLDSDTLRGEDAGVVAPDNRPLLRNDDRLLYDEADCPSSAMTGVTCLELK